MPVIIVGQGARQSHHSAMAMPSSKAKKPAITNASHFECQTVGPAKDNTMSASVMQQQQQHPETLNRKSKPGGCVDQALPARRRTARQPGFCHSLSEVLA